ncbi:hypothetical protein [Pseudomonas sp. RL_105y_Pfl1_103]|uniref:hypothetical protein n=1 Tax=Pseudomonas sp. RL_105y_Pfl1_103 TaxID=3088707 RepID=UPI0030DD85B7
MTDNTELKRLAEAFPADLDWDSNTEPFFNGPSGESLGGGSTGFYCVYGAPFEIDGEQYDGHTYVETCKVDFAKFMCAARDGVLALIAENQRLGLKADSLEFAKWSCQVNEQAIRAAGHETIEDLAEDRDQLRAEVADLKTGYEAYERVNAALRAEVEGLRKDKDRLDALESNFWDVRHDSHPIADTGDSSSSLEIVGHWMDKPFERVIGEDWNENLRAAIDQAMKAPAYPTARPEYPEFDDIPDFSPGNGNSARRRAASLGIDYDAAMSQGEQS